MTGTQKLTVHIGEEGLEVGTLFFERRQGRETSTFRYALSWLESNAAFALSPAMPLAETPYRGSQSADRMYPFPGPIADVCPDSWGREVARLDYPKDGAPVTAMDYLAGIDDVARLGALRFSDAEGEYLRPSDIAQGFKSSMFLRVKDLALSARAIESRSATTIDIRRLRGVGTALGGARPKAVVMDEEGGLHIAKFSASGERLATEKMEVATQKLATSVGITACEVQLIINKDFDPVALIKRFDRSSSGKRLHYVSARTMLDVDRAVGSTYTEIALAIREYGESPDQQLRELFRRVAFTVLVSNVDDHLMNHGFLHARGGKWRLAPMFDVNPAPERASTMKTAISETSGNEASIEALLEVGHEFGMAKDKAARVVGEMARRISATWRPIAQETGMTAAEIKAYTDAFEHEQSRAAMKLVPKKL